MITSPPDSYPHTNTLMTKNFYFLLILDAGSARAGSDKFHWRRDGQTDKDGSTERSDDCCHSAGCVGVRSCILFH